MSDELPVCQEPQIFPDKIIRKNWYKERPKHSASADSDGFFEIERAYVLDKATRTGCSLNEHGQYEWDNARGWAIVENGKESTISVQEFIEYLWMEPNDMVKVVGLDGFWCLKVS